MSFKEIVGIKNTYKTPQDDVISDFYIPCLEHAREYKRAVGFFSSTIFLKITRGLGAFADHGGTMQLLVSPRLDPGDFEAMKSGYQAREEFGKKLAEGFDFDVEFDQKEARFAMLSHMIARKMLEIKIVVTEDPLRSMYHKKIGILKDEDDNKISFSGSANETLNGYENNIEEFDVFCSWRGEDPRSRCEDKDLEFNYDWIGRSRGVITIPFPEVIRERLLSYGRNYNGPSFAEIDQEYVKKLFQERHKDKGKKPCLPEDRSLRDYQTQAINEWERNGYRGIFDMATGTGKTYTGAGAICRLFQAKGRLITIICCPYTHLVDQWCEELKVFNIEAIKCCSGESYEKQLERAFTKFRQRRIDFVCVVITNSSFQIDRLQEIFVPQASHTLLVADEAHNFGAGGIAKTLRMDYAYRLALSATLERHGDEVGTQLLYNFFGSKCIEYDLERAINEGKLTRYRYYPIPVSLDEDEYDDYVKLSREIAKFHSPDGTLCDAAKRKLLKRARIVAGAKEKLSKLKEVIEPYKKSNNMLVYCGAVNYADAHSNNSQDERQITAVLQMLTQDFGMYASRFTSAEKQDERKRIIKAFVDEDIQAIVAIKCLDEGVNIPAIKTAFILASSTNPKEYIQRRGRVLRKAPGKDYAVIYDFVTLPHPLERGASLGSPNLAIEKNMARKEFKRIEEFALLSMNPSDSTAMISKIKERFYVDTITDEEDIYE